MKNTFWHRVILMFAFLACLENIYANPAPRKITTINQPDGTLLSVWLKGDEFFHYALSTDGYVLLPDKNGFYTYAVHDSSGALRAGNRIAVNEDKRTYTDQLFLKTIQPSLSFSKSQLTTAINKRAQNAIAKKVSLRSTNNVTPGLISDYQKTGKPKSLIILVNFSDVKFKSDNTAAEFSNMLNQKGYHEGYHIGSSRDYLKDNSKGLFTPDFVVVGPVNLTKEMSYYGQNDLDGNDLHPAQMVYDACKLAADSVDFSDFDNNNDGYVDNVYVFYAGMGEAESGKANTIWPHSSVLSNESLSLKLNNKFIYEYACSSELNNAGNRSGIGTFTHEYFHILGLPDMYDVDYEINGEGFDLNDWSLMAYGEYNGNGCVPPFLTILERKLLGWDNPVELNSPASIAIPGLSSTNQGYIIKTDDAGEYFLLENRQPLSNPWDYYLPYHGMLIYHIDMRKNATTSISYSGTTYDDVSFEYLWTINMLNAIAKHQCADIEEADNSPLIYTGFNEQSYFNSIKGDPFPGNKSINTFTDMTLPSMKTWSGKLLNKPITSISENGVEISFNFMGGSDFKTPPSPLPANDIKPFKFTANWEPVENATGYYLDVYTQKAVNGSMVRTFIPGYENLLVQNTSSIIYVPKDSTKYDYSVRATNNISITPSSKVTSITTTNGTPVAYPATDVDIFGFTSNWKTEECAIGYYLDVYRLDSTVEGDTVFKYVDGYKNRYTTENTLSIKNLDDQTTYHYRIKYTTGYTNSGYSNVISLTTSKSAAIRPYVKEKTIYLKGIDRGCTVKVYDPMGILRYTTSTTNEITVKNSGIYLIETMFNGKRKTIKILVK